MKRSEMREILIGQTLKARSPYWASLNGHATAAAINGCTDHGMQRTGAAILTESESGERHIVVGTGVGSFSARYKVSALSVAISNALFLKERMVAAVVVDNKGPIAPCSDCRGRALFHGGPDLKFWIGRSAHRKRIRSAAQLLPWAYDKNTAFSLSPKPIMAATEVNESALYGDIPVTLPDKTPVRWPDEQVVTWNELLNAALDVRTGAYAREWVGSAGLVVKGNKAFGILPGFNVENFDQPSACAEPAILGSMHALAPGAQLVAVATVGAHGDIKDTCLSCRRFLRDHGGADLQILTNSGPQRAEECNSDAFSVDSGREPAPIHGDHPLGIPGLGLQRCCGTWTNRTAPTSTMRSPM